MSSSQKVLDFCSLFSELLVLTNEDPLVLKERFAHDAAVKRLAVKVAEAALPFEMDEYLNKELIVTPVDRTFYKLWKKYQSGYNQLLQTVGLGLGNNLNEEELSDFREFDQDENWKRADAAALSNKRILDMLINVARNEFDANDGFQDDADMEMEYWQGFRLWDFDLPAIGFDPRIMLRRYGLLKIVMLTHDVDRKAGDGVTSVKAYLWEAQRAFILGSDFGSLILLRSVIEVSLERLYYNSKIQSAQNSTLNDGNELFNGLDATIKNCIQLSDIEKQKLLYIKKLADNLVHKGDYRRTKSFVENRQKFEIEMAKHFETVKNLIEEAPS